MDRNEISNPNAKRFLDAYAIIEKKLEEICRETRYIPFGQLLSRCVKVNRVVALKEADLRQYNELRNAIVHERGKENEIIAEPTDSVTDDIEKIAVLLQVDDNIMNYASTPVRTVRLETDIIDAFKEMDKLGSSKIPVYEEGVYKGLLTVEAIARWALEEKHSNDRVGDILKENAKERVLFLKESSSVNAAIKGFEGALNHGSILLAVIITKSGALNEKPVGIITVADLPKILSNFS